MPRLPNKAIIESEISPENNYRYYNYRNKYRDRPPVDGNRIKSFKENRESHECQVGIREIRLIGGIPVKKAVSVRTLHIPCFFDALHWIARAICRIMESSILRMTESINESQGEWLHDWLPTVG